MKRIKNKKMKHSIGKIMLGILVGSVLGATVGWLTAPASGAELRRRIKGEALGPRGAQERAKTAAGNVESRARELAADVNRHVDDRIQSAPRRKKAVSTI
jgi:gas vesicle protein